MDSRPRDQEGMDQSQTDLSLVTERIRQLEQRIAQLEATRKIRVQFLGLSFIIFVFILLTIVYGAIGRVSRRLDTTTLVAEEIFLKNQHTNSEAVLFFDKEHKPAIGFYDDRRVCRMNLGLAGNGVPVLAFYDEQGKARLNVCARSIDGKASVIATFGSSHNYKCVELGVAPGDLPFVQFNDDSGRNRVMIRMAEDGKAILQLGNPDGTRFIQLLTAPDSGPSTLKIIGKENDEYVISK